MSARVPGWDAQFRAHIRAGTKRSPSLTSLETALLWLTGVPINHRSPGGGGRCTTSWWRRSAEREGGGERGTERDTGIHTHAFVLWNQNHPTDLSEKHMTGNVSHLERSDSAEGEDDDENDWSVCTGAEEDPPPGLGDAASFTGIKTHRQASRSAVFKGAFHRFHHWPI